MDENIEAGPSWRISISSSNTISSENEQSSERCERQSGRGFTIKDIFKNAVKDRCLINRMQYCSTTLKTITGLADSRYVISLRLTKEQLNLIREAIKSKVTPEFEGFFDPHCENLKLKNISSYSVGTIVGRGSFGIVYAAREGASGQKFALKLFFSKDEEGLNRSALREAMILKNLKHENIVELIEICDSEDFAYLCRPKDFYLIYSFCEIDLSRLIHAVKLREVEIKTLAVHFFKALQYLHTCNVVHRDLKSTNLLIDNKGILKLADFGSSQVLLSDFCFDEQMSSQFGAVFYRAPEIFFGMKGYETSADCWSAGCVFVEMFTGSVFFSREKIPGKETSQDVINNILNYCGSIDPDALILLECMPFFSDYVLPTDKPRILPTVLNEWIRDAEAMTIVEKLLCYDKTMRYTAEEVLSSKYFFQQPFPEENIQVLLGSILLWITQ